MERLDSERVMRKVSLAVSAVSLALMLGGFVALMLNGASPAIPGEPALPLGSLLDPTPRSPSQSLMSGGIVLLALLPGARVALACGMFARRRHRLPDALVALGVLLELLLSMWMGR